MNKNCEVCPLQIACSNETLILSSELMQLPFGDDFEVSTMLIREIDLVERIGQQALQMCNGPNYGKRKFFIAGKRKPACPMLQDDLIKAQISNTFLAKQLYKKSELQPMEYN